RPGAPRQGRGTARGATTIPRIRWIHPQVVSLHALLRRQRRTRPHPEEARSDHIHGAIGVIPSPAIGFFFVRGGDKNQKKKDGRKKKPPTKAPRTPSPPPGKPGSTVIGDYRHSGG